MSSDDNIASDETLTATDEDLRSGTERYCPGCDSSFPASIDRCPTDGTFLIELADDDSLVGTQIDGRFTIKHKLGSGGMGSVYSAVQHSMDRRVAIKVIHAHLSRDRQSAKRFLRETKLASSLSHPHTVMVLDFGQMPDRRLYMVMELVAGHTLATLLEREGRFEPRRAIDVGVQVCDAIEAAHRLKIVHRDLKPSNIMIEDSVSGRDFVKVLDFGLAKSLAGDETTVTESNAIMGTPQYIPPELAVGKAADGRADLYSFGAVLYEMTGGRPIFSGDTVQAILFRQVHEPPPPLPDFVPAGLAAVIMKLLAKKPENRFQTASDLRNALLAVRAGRDPGIGRPRAPEAFAVTIDPGSARLVAVTEGLTETVDSRWQAPEPSADVVEQAIIASTSAAVAAATEVAKGAGEVRAPHAGAKIAWVLVPIVIAAAGLLFMLNGGGQDASRSGGDQYSAGQQPEKTEAPPDVNKKNNKVDDVGENDVQTKQPLAPEPDPEPVMVTVALESSPDGAVVTMGKRRLCTTPCKHDFDRTAGALQLRFKRNGYRLERRTLEPASDRRLRVELVTKASSRPHADAQSPPPVFTDPYATE